MHRRSLLTACAAKSGFTPKQLKKILKDGSKFKCPKTGFHQEIICE